MYISVVVPVYNEEQSLLLFHKKITESLENLVNDYEIIFVNDGSNDESFNILNSLQKNNRKIRLLNLEERKGQLYSLLKGIKISKGEIIITLDCDLQYDISEISKFYQKIEEGYEAVFGERKTRKDAFYRIIISKMANFIIRILTGTKVSDLGCSFNAFNRKIYKKIKSKYGKNIFITKPLLAKFSKKSLGIKVTHYKRKKGQSKNNLLYLFLLFMINLFGTFYIFSKFQNYLIINLFTEA